MKKVFVPTCRVCEKLNDIMTHCAIFGLVEPENVDSPSYAYGCTETKDYVRLIHAVPNEHNFLDPKQIEEAFEFQIYSNDTENQLFTLRHGMTLEEWATATFRNKGGPTDESDK